MIILGISGLNEREHDTSCCLIKNNEIIAFAEEERFNRIKHSPGEIPSNSIIFCLKEGRIRVSDVDQIAIGWDYSINPYWNKNPDIFPILFPGVILKNKPSVCFFPHHLSHAASSFLFSGFQESLFMVFDGQGETESISIGFAKYKNKRAKLNIIKTYPINLSIGYMYDKIGEFIGLGHWSAGKLMGLSSYGSKRYKLPIKLLRDGNYKIDILDEFRIGKGQLDDEDQIGNLWKKMLKIKFGVIKNDINNPSRKAKDIALTAQHYFENISFHIMDFLVKKYPKIKNLCFAGGAALNCVNNTKIIEKFGFKNFFCLPAANDAGVALGAAGLALNMAGIKPLRLTHPYFGPKYSDSEIISVCKRFRLIYEKKKDIEKYCAHQLSNGKIIAWFQDRMEFGPRALGNRSIFAIATKRDNLKKINKIKKRELWRPLAPVVLVEDGEKIFPSSKKSHFMLQTHKISGKFLGVFPAIEHIDGTSRPQIVKKSINKKLYRLLIEYKKISGYGLLINTSFNTLKEEPVVCSPLDAVRNFIKSDLDLLIINDFVIRKNK